MRKQQFLMVTGGAVARFRCGACSGAPENTAAVNGNVKSAGQRLMATGDGSSNLSAVC